MQRGRHSREGLRGILGLRGTLGLGALIGFLGIVTLGASEPREQLRSFEFIYESIIPGVEEGRGPVHVFVPIPASGPHQVVVTEVEASIPGRIEQEGRYGNRFWHGSVERSDGKPIEFRAKVRVQRRVARVGKGADARWDDPLLFVGANERVVVGHPMLEPILAEIEAATPRGKEEPAASARAIYDWVVDNVEYKKVGTGWGNGDTFWACTERYGNCTDFHSLFISLARSRGIPARFEMGFPVPENREAGEVAGYHCWVSMYLPEVGWLPLDASEASKSPGKRELYYGRHPADRLHFTTGRDLRLGPDHHDRPLNYFVYPYVEVGGQALAAPTESRFTYRTGSNQSG